MEDNEEVELPEYCMKYATVVANKKDAYAKLTEIQKNRGQNQDRFLEKCAQERDKAHGGDQATIFW